MWIDHDTNPSSEQVWSIVMPFLFHWNELYDRAICMPPCALTTVVVQVVRAALFGAKSCVVDQLSLLCMSSAHVRRQPLPVWPQTLTKIPLPLKTDYTQPPLLLFNMVYCTMLKSSIVSFSICSVTIICLRWTTRAMAERFTFSQRQAIFLFPSVAAGVPCCDLC